MVIDMGYWTKVIKRIVIFVLSIFIFCLTLKMLAFFMPFLIAFIIALCIEPIIKKLNKKFRLSRRTSTIIVMSVFFLIIIGVLVWGIVTLISEAYNLLQGINVYFDKGKELLDFIGSKFNNDGIRLPEEVSTFIQSSSNDFLNNLAEFIKDILNSVLTFITQIPTICIYIGITIIATYFICIDRIYMLDQLEHHFPRLWVKRFSKHLREVISALGSYFKAEMILVFISFVVLLIGLIGFKIYGLNVEYPLLVAIIIAFVDALPILGSGTVMLPWAVIEAVNGDITLGIALIVLYIVIMVVRQLLEPKIVSNQIGIHPIFTLIAMYTGFQFIGVTGLLIGPIILIIIKCFFASSIDNGIVTSIFER